MKSLPEITSRRIRANPANAFAFGMAFENRQNFSKTS